jgi:hypothetical protein
VLSSFKNKLCKYMGILSRIVRLALHVNRNKSNWNCFNLVFLSVLLNDKMH